LGKKKFMVDLNLHGVSQKEKKEKTNFRQDNRIDRIF
jgi:DNA/RNA endonuclease G (NUC1)